MIVSGRPTTEELAKTFSPFLNKERVNVTTLPSNIETKRDKFERKYGTAYTIATIATAIGIFYAIKKGGIRPDIRKFFKKNLLLCKTKTMEAINHLNEYPLLQKTKLKTMLLCSTIGQKILNIGNFVGNLNPLKDILFDRFTKFCKVKPFFDKLQEIFTHSAKKLVFSKYNVATKNLTSLKNTLQETIKIAEKMPTVTFKGRTISGAEFARYLAKNTEKMFEEMQHISGKSFAGRFNNTVSMLNSNTEKEFLKTLSSFKGNEHQSVFRRIYEKVKETGDFLPAKILEEKHKGLFEGLFTSKSKLSNSILDLYHNISKSIDNIFDTKIINNNELRRSYLRLQDLLDKFKTPSTYGVKRAIARNDILQELSTAMTECKKIGEIGKFKALENLKNLIQNDKKGILEETISACKFLKQTSPEMYAKLVKQRNKFQKSLNEAVSFESEKTYGKLLDFSLHSLPTDFLSMTLGAMGLGYVSLSKNKSREEKISVNLEKGIPVLGGLVVSFLSNMRQVASGTGSLFLGFISAVILNRIGKVMNNFYMNKHTAKQQTENTQAKLA